MLGRRSTVRAAALVLLAAPLAAPLALRTARAQTAPAPFSLSWEAPAECPDESAVRRAVAQLLGEGPPPPAHVSARAVVEHTASGGWNVRISTVRDGATGERVVQSQSCQSLADATALIVALTIDPERVAARAPGVSAAPASPASAASAAAAPPSASTSASAPLPPSPSPSQAPAAPPSASSAAPAPAVPLTPAREAESSAPPPASGPTLFALFAQMGGDVGTLPRAAFTAGGGVALTLGSLRFEGYGTYLLPQSTYAPPSLPSLGTRLDLLAGGLRGCFLPLRGSLEAGGCAGLELGDLHGHGFQSGRPSPYIAFTPADAGGLWLAATLSGRASWRVARSFALVIDVGLLVPLRRDTYDIDLPGGTVVLHQPGPVEGRASIGPEVRF